MKQILSNDYEGLYECQLDERKEFQYPPFSRLIRIYFKHKDRSVVTKAAHFMAENLKKVEGIKVLGPEFPPHSRIQDLYIKSILLKTQKSKSYMFMRELIKRNISAIYKKKEFSSMKIYSDVDPQ